MMRGKEEILKTANGALSTAENHSDKAIFENIIAVLILEALLDIREILRNSLHINLK